MCNTTSATRRVYSTWGTPNLTTSQVLGQTPGRQLGGRVSETQRDAAARFRRTLPSTLSINSPDAPGTYPSSGRQRWELERIQDI